MHYYVLLKAKIALAITVSMNYAMLAVNAVNLSLALTPSQRPVNIHRSNTKKVLIIINMQEAEHLNNLKVCPLSL